MSTKSLVRGRCALIETGGAAEAATRRAGEAGQDAKRRPRKRRTRHDLW
jgi:hypothetical protein